MIKANELRIGNIIIDAKDPDRPDLFIVAAANIGFVETITDNHYEPVALTEEWLKRMGFENREAPKNYSGGQPSFWIRTSHLQADFADSQDENNIPK